MKTKSYKKLISLLLVMIFVLHAVYAFADQRNVLDSLVVQHSDWIVHHEVVDINGVVVEQVSELAGSIFSFRLTDEYTYSSQLTPYGYYIFAFGFNDSNIAFYEHFYLAETPLITQHLDISAFNKSELSRGRSQSLDSEMMLEYSSALSSLIIANLDNLSIGVRNITTIYHSNEILDGNEFQLVQME